MPVGLAGGTAHTYSLFNRILPPRPGQNNSRQAPFMRRPAGVLRCAGIAFGNLAGVRALPAPTTGSPA